MEMPAIIIIVVVVVAVIINNCIYTCVVVFHMSRRQIQGKQSF